MVFYGYEHRLQLVQTTLVRTKSLTALKAV